MRCEVVAIGTELLLGQIVDSNSGWIGQQLAAHGVSCHFHTKVGDNHQRLVGVLRQASQRSEVVICCGGLGPTPDDLTRHAIAELMAVPLVRQEALVKKIAERFTARGRSMPSSNLQQADVPQGAHALSIMPGTAPGLCCPLPTGGWLYAVPGVPSEMRQMVEQAILPDIAKKFGGQGIIASRVLRTWGLSESSLAERIAPRLQALEGSQHTTLAFLASGAEGIKIRITVKAQDQISAEKHLSAEQKQLNSLLGSVVFGVDNDTLESVVLATMANRNQRLAVLGQQPAALALQRLAAIDSSITGLVGGLPQLQRLLHCSSANPSLLCQQAAEQLAVDYVLWIGDIQADQTAHVGYWYQQQFYAKTVTIPNQREHHWLISTHAVDWLRHGLAIKHLIKKPL